MALVHQKRFGLIFRIFAKTEGQVEQNAEQVLAGYTKATDLHLDGRPFFSKVLILVASDRAYADCDCGKTASYLRGRLPAKAAADVLDVRHGDLFCGLLNYGVAKLLRERIDFVTILSHGALSYLREDVLKQMVDAFERGAAVSGIAIEELSQYVLEGRIANTFATWDAVKLMTVGGFDFRAAQPKKDDPTASYLQGWSEEKGEVFYPRAGVEEIIPLIRLGRTFGPCIAPIKPVGVAEWETPDPITDRQGYERHLKKMGTKLQRQTAHAAFESADVDAIKGFVMPAYRTF